MQLSKATRMPITAADTKIRVSRFQVTSCACVRERAVIRSRQSNLQLLQFATRKKCNLNPRTTPVTRDAPAESSNEITSPKPRLPRWPRFARPDSLQPFPGNRGRREKWCPCSRRCTRSTQASCRIPNRRPSAFRIVVEPASPVPTVPNPKLPITKLRRPSAPRPFAATVLPIPAIESIHNRVGRDPGETHGVRQVARRPSV